MIDSRQYIIERLKSKKVTIDEFNYDRLDAPPLSYFLNPYDIMRLNKVATSLKLQSKPEERYRQIDRILREKGLIKLGAGTNRVIYRHPEFPEYVFKIAADNVGLGDNPAEYRNQFLLKPFVAKTYEISPCGTVALSEKVNPVNSREEFISIADDIFEVITEFLIGKYVLADIGEKFFMNWGTRIGFGPVLLDYPYLYELDGNKIYCSKEDPLSVSGRCDGEIDYDAGFNFLHCTKCGARYKAAELKKDIENKLIKIGGNSNMKITTRGSKGTRVFGESDSPFKPEAVSVYRTMEVKKSKVPVAEEPKKEEKPIVEVEKVAEVDSPKFKKFPDKTVNGVLEHDKVIDPVRIDENFGEDCRKEAEEKKEEKPPVQAFDEAIKAALAALDKIDIDMVKDDAIIRAINRVSKKLTDKSSFQKADLAKELMESYESDIEEAKEASNVTPTVDCVVTTVEGDNENNIVDVYYTANVTVGEKEYSIDKFFTMSNVKILQDDEEEIEEDAEETVEEAVEEKKADNNDVAYIEEVSAYLIDKRDLANNVDHKSILVMSRDGGQTYLKNDDGAIIAIDTIDEKGMNALKIVSASWLEGLTSNLADIKEAPTGVLPPQEDNKEE